MTRICELGCSVNAGVSLVINYLYVTCVDGKRRRNSLGVNAGF